MDLANNKLISNNIENNIISDWEELKRNWQADLFRYTGKISKSIFFRALIRNNSYRYTFLMRSCTYLSKNKNNIFKQIGFRFFFEIFRDYALKSGIEITYNTKIGCGLYIPHLIGIVINENAVIGRNCNISQNVTIGDLKRGERIGSPLIGDNVYIAPGAVIIGNIRIGNNVAVGANCVVNKDLPDNAVAVGIPASIISYKGSMEYISRIDY
jgi:serine O-acetyltransferase